jgi:Tol biopolymer transport system component
MKIYKMIPLAVISSILIVSCGGSSKNVEPTPEPTQFRKKAKTEDVFGQIDDIEDGIIIPREYTMETVESSPNAKSVTQITSNNEKDVSIKDPDHHPVDEIIIYTEYREPSGFDLDLHYSSVIWSQNPEAKARVRVTEGTFNNSQAVFNNSGTDIIFSSARSNKNRGIWKIKSDGLGGILKLTEFSTSSLQHPTIGALDQIAFHAVDPRYKSNDGDDDRPFIWLMADDGSLPTQLRYGRNPNFSPAGNIIVFTRKDERNAMGQIFTMDTDGGAITQLTFNVDYDIKDPAWDPSGSFITYVSNEGKTASESDTTDLQSNNDYNIWVMRSDGTNKTQLTTNQSHDDQPVFNPDGEYIYFRSNRGGFWNVWRFETVF